jgi:hypothetical protein
MIDSFSHGQVASKMWLCENIEPLVKKDATVMILGSWVNVLGFMMLTRNPTQYKHIRGIDIDVNAIQTADQINSYWFIEGILRNTAGDANTIPKEGYDIVINCSGEHMNSTEWFDTIPAGTLVCIQSSNIVDTKHPWYVTNPSPTFESFMEKYPLNIKFAGTLPIRYSDWGYDRYMVIGIKQQSCQ